MTDGVTSLVPASGVANPPSAKAMVKPAANSESNFFYLPKQLSSTPLKWRVQNSGREAGEHFFLQALSIHDQTGSANGADDHQNHLRRCSRCRPVALDYHLWTHHYDIYGPQAFSGCRSRRNGRGSHVVPDSRRRRFPSFYVQVQLSMYVAQHWGVRIRKLCFCCLMGLEFEWCGAETSGELTTCVASDVDLIQVGNWRLGGHFAHQDVRVRWTGGRSASALKTLWLRLQERTYEGFYSGACSPKRQFDYRLRFRVSSSSLRNPHRCNLHPPDLPVLLTVYWLHPHMYLELFARTG
jgi:hypothetical protein